MENARAFGAEVAKEGRPSWEALAIVLNEDGLKNRGGRPIQPGTLRQTWYRVRCDLLAMGQDEGLAFGKPPRGKPRRRAGSARRAPPVAAPSPPVVDPAPTASGADDVLEQLKERQAWR
jgi:hypothetical protein